MNRPVIASFLISSLAAFQPVCALARSPLVERLRERGTEREAVELSYGLDPLQKLDYWRPQKPGSPLVVFVHGGGWTRGDKSDAVGQKATHFLQQGYGFASLNYRLVPSCTVEQQARDVSAALAFLIRQAGSLGFDKTKVVLMGHSAGAHLSALVGTDTGYLEKSGLGSKSLLGVVLLDGACYDVPRQIATAGDLMHDTYIEAFGSAPARQLALSPAHYAAAPNASQFLILHVQRVDGAAQSAELGEVLKKAGTKEEVIGFAGLGLKGHAEINRRLGDPTYPATPVVDQWLARVFAK